MIVLRCTGKAAAALGFHRERDVQPGTSPLGDWYVNLVATIDGGVFLFMNEQSLLAVIVPRYAMMSMNVFVARVGNLLSMIGVPNERIEEEIEHFRGARAGRTVSRKVRGVMNGLAARCQERVEMASPAAKVSISDFELELAKMPQPTLGFRTAADVAVEFTRFARGVRRRLNRRNRRRANASAAGRSPGCGAPLYPPPRCRR
jgi:hypothetical protein